jgi:REP element-mobilizing transposase RayT
MEDDIISRFDRELDAGWGACWLRNPAVASIVQDTLLFFDGERYRLLGWCVMPNHVHAVFEMLDTHSLSATIKGWKSFTSKQANAQLGRSGAFWDADYFDRYMRNEAHLMQTIGYVENNPVKAGLVSEPSAWQWSSAGARTSRSAHES